MNVDQFNTPFVTLIHAKVWKWIFDVRFFEGIYQFILKSHHFEWFEQICPSTMNLRWLIQMSIKIRNFDRIQPKNCVLSSEFVSFWCPILKIFPKGVFYHSPSLVA